MLWIDNTGIWVLFNGRLDKTDSYLDCGRPRCDVCHWEKLDPARRDREKRAWKREVEEQL